MKRLSRYLGDKPRLVFKYPFQDADRIECYSDTDWSGCTKTRKSTSGGILMLGGHVLKTWSSTQPTVSLFSVEAEFYGVVKASGLALGQQSILRDLGIDLPVRVWTDSSAAMGICARQGLGKLRHIATHTLWVQEKVRSHAIELRKVRGEANPADIFTKHLSSRDRAEALMKLFNCEFREGRPDGAPQLKRDAAVEVQVMGEFAEITDSHELDSIPMHDAQVLPHHYQPEDLEQMFPRATAPECITATELQAENEWALKVPAARVSADAANATTSTSTVTTTSASSVAPAPSSGTAPGTLRSATSARPTSSSAAATSGSTSARLPRKLK